MTTGRDDSASDDRRPTPIGSFNTIDSSTKRKRHVPAPWIDCPACGWRHYPSVDGGRWHIATKCEGCATDLAADEAD